MYDKRQCQVGSPGNPAQLRAELAGLFQLVRQPQFGDATEKAIALRYGQDSDAARGLSYVMEYELDSLNRGALIQWLSQYPGEAEVFYWGKIGRGLRGSPDSPGLSSYASP